jgi:hypothetical protein
MEPLSFLIISVDGGGIISTPNALKEVIEALSKPCRVKTVGEMSKLFACHIIDTTDKDGV